MENFWLNKRSSRSGSNFDILDFAVEKCMIEIEFLEIWSSSPNQTKKYYHIKFKEVISKYLNYSFDNLWFYTWCDVCSDSNYKSRLEILDAVDKFITILN